MFYNRCRLLRKNKDVADFIMGSYKTSMWLKNVFNKDGKSGYICYYIDEYGKQVGFFSEVIFTLFRLYFADQRGLVPLIEWGKRHLYYEPDGVNGEKNVFRYYFAPVSKLKDKNESMYTVYSCDYHIGELQDIFDTHGYDISNMYVEALSAMVQKYLKYNDETQRFMEEEFDRLLGNKKTLAVHFRGTDYRRQYNNHPVFITIEDEISKARELVASKGYEQIFLATDEQLAVNRFKEEFGSRLKIYEDAYRAMDGDESVAYSKSERRHHHYRLGLEVLRDQYTMTRCSGLVCGISNLTICARLMRNAWYEPYEDLIVLDNGINRNDKRFSEIVH